MQNETTTTAASEISVMAIDAPKPPRKLEFYSYKHMAGKAAEHRMQIIGRTKDMREVVLAELTPKDFNDMHRVNLQGGMLEDIVKYCNANKGTKIGAFIPTVF